MSLLANLRPGGRHGVASTETRDPIGHLVAGLCRLAQTDLLDRLGLRKQAEQTVFTVTRSGFSTITTTSRTFKRAGTRGKAGVRPPATKASGLFDLTPTEDEQLLVDVVTEFATEVVRPAAAAADAECAAPEALLKAGLEIGLPVLGLPETLGGVAEERSAMAGTLVAEALAKGDMGLAVADAGAGLGGDRDRPLGQRRAAADLPPGVHRRRRAGRRAGAHRAAGALRRAQPADHRGQDGRRLRAQRREVRWSRAAPTPSSSWSAPSSTASRCCSWSSPRPRGWRSRATRRWACAPPR